MKDYLPIVISLISAIVAAISLGWNVYRDVFSKARVKMSASRVVILSHGKNPQGPFLKLSATNMGPGPLKIDNIQFSSKPWYKPFNQSGGFIMYDWKNPLSAKLPARMEPGEGIFLLLLWSDQGDCIFKLPFSRLGVGDSFGRNHWVPGKQIRYLKKKFAEEFPKTHKH